MNLHWKPNGSFMTEIISLPGFCCGVNYYLGLIHHTLLTYNIPKPQASLLRRWQSYPPERRQTRRYPTTHTKNTAVKISICVILEPEEMYVRSYQLIWQNMKKVFEMKHLGVIIKSSGEVAYEDNILPIETAIRQIIHTLSLSTLNPIERSLFSRFLLTSKTYTGYTA